MYDVTKPLAFYKNSCFFSLSWKIMALIRFHLLLLVFISSSHLLLYDVKMLSILIKNYDFEESQEHISIPSVFIALIWVQGIKTNFWGSETSQSYHQTLDRKYDWVQAVFYSLTHRKQYSVVKPIVYVNGGSDPLFFAIF